VPFYVVQKIVLFFPVAVVAVVASSLSIMICASSSVPR